VFRCGSAEQALCSDVVARNRFSDRLDEVDDDRKRNDETEGNDYCYPSVQSDVETLLRVDTWKTLKN